MYAIVYKSDGFPICRQVPGVSPDPSASPAVVAREWTRLGLIGFGGPPAHIALLRQLVVVQRRWMDARAFEDANAACGLLPGPASTQLAIFCAYRVAGVPGEPGNDHGPCAERGRRNRQDECPDPAAAGNRECRADFTDGVAAAKKNFPNVINLNQVRVVEFPEALVRGRLSRRDLHSDLQFHVISDLAPNIRIQPLSCRALAWRSCF